MAFLSVAWLVFLDETLQLNGALISYRYRTFLGGDLLIWELAHVVIHLLTLLPHDGFGLPC